MVPTIGKCSLKIYACFSILAVRYLEQRLVNPLVNKKVVIIREEQLTIGKLLGEGNFGKVFAGEYRDEHGKMVSGQLKREAHRLRVLSSSGSRGDQSLEGEHRFEIEGRDEERSLRDERTLSSMYCPSLWCDTIKEVEQYTHGTAHLLEAFLSLTQLVLHRWMAK